MYVNIYTFLFWHYFQWQAEELLPAKSISGGKRKKSQELTYLSELYPGSLVLKLPAVLKTAGETQGATAVSL